MMVRIKFSEVHVLLTVVIAVFSTSIDAVLLGCYKEKTPIPHFIVNPGAYGKSPLTPQICYTLCGGMKFNYAALGSGKFCRCSNTSPVGILDPDPTTAKCSMTCPGSADKCGSADHVNVYRTPIPVEITLTTSVNTIASGSQVDLIPTVDPSNTGFDLRIDFDDSAGKTAYAENGTDLLSRTYHEAGEYEIRSFATDVDNLLTDVESATYVLVQSVPSGVLITCPSAMVTYEEDICFIKVSRGTNMEMTISFSDGNPGPLVTQSLSISDAIEYSLGNYVQEHIQSADIPSYISGTSTNGLIVQHGNPAEYNGELVGLEYYGVGTGSLDVYVYRPDCAPQVYCFETNTCENTCARTCGGGTGGYCSDVGDCCDVPTSRSSILLPSYTHVHTITIGSVTPGYGFEPAPAGLDIQPGDVIAHTGLATPLIAKGAPEVPAGSLHDFYCNGVIGPASFTAVQCVLTSELHQLKAIYAQPSETMFPLQFTNLGLVTFEVTVASLDPVNIPGSDTSSFAINVLEGVNAAIFDVPLYVATNVPTMFAVEPYTGSPATIDWNFETGADNGMDLNPVSFTYLTIGQYNLTVNISNDVSFKFNSTTIIVQEPISGLTINTPSGNVEVNAASAIDVTLLSGSNYTCVFDFSYSDGTVESISKTWLDGLNFNHIFSIAGGVDLFVNCTNNLASVTTSKFLLAIEPLTNVALTPPGALVGESFYLMLTWDSGTDVTLNSFSYDGTPVPMIVNETLRQAVSTEARQEMVTGTHTVAFDISNPLGLVSEIAAAFAIEVEIIKAVIDCTFLNPSVAISDSEYNLIPLNTDVECTVDMEQGTSVEILVDYGNGYNDSLTASAAQTWASAEATFAFPVVYTYTTTGYFQLKVTVSNAFNSVDKIYPVGVMVGVDSTEMNGVQPVRFGPPALLNFTFSITGPIPNDVKCTIEWGDGNYDVYDPCDVNSIFSHEYLDKDGTLTLTYTLENMVSTKTGTIPVYIVTPIINNECYTSKKAASKGEPIGLVFKTWRGPPPGELNLTYVPDTSVPGTFIARTRQYNGPEAEEIEFHTYPSTGPMTMSVRAESQLEDKLCTHMFEVLNPVKDAFDVYVPAAPIDYEFDPTCNLDYSILYTGTPLPDDAQVEIDHGDNTTYGPVTFHSTIDDSHSYASDGHYISTIRIFNDASEITKTILTGCYATFSTPIIQVLRTPYLPMNSPDLPGFGVAQNIFRADEPIRIHTTLQTGTFVWWEVTATSPTDIYSCNSTDEIITLNIDKYGTYTVTVTPWNPVHSGPSVNFVAEVMRPVDNITITDYMQTNANDDKNFNVSMVNYGTGMCVAVNFGDEAGEVELYGDAATCSDRTKPDAYFSSASYKNGILTDVSDSFGLTHQYLAEGTYTLDMFAWNDLSSATAEFQFAVSAIDCGAPNVNIRDRARDFRYPMVHRRKNRIKTTGVTNPACPETLKNTKLWTVFSVDQNTNTILGEVDMASVPSRLNSELALKPHFLSYGVYLLKYKVTMLTKGANGEEFSSLAETFIQVDRSDLVVVLLENSMSQLSVGPNVLLTLSPKEFSYDPDVDIANGETDSFNSFMMACRDVTLNETFPDESVEVIALNITDLPPGHVDTHGCFQQGPGWIRNFDGQVSFLTGILKPDHIYEVKVIGRKDTRSATAFGQVHVKSADPPSCMMEFKIAALLKSSAGGKNINPNYQLGMLANMLTPCQTCTYEWQMFAYDYQFCGPEFGCWRNLAYLERYIEGTLSQELTVHVEVFGHYADVDLFQLRLTCTDGDTGISGTTSLNLTRNDPPARGNCTFSPGNGTAMTTNFTIDCSGYSDTEDDEIANYLILCDSDKEVVQVADDKWPHWKNVLLPLGDRSEGYTLKCNVTVTDDRGSSGTYPIQEVTVTPMSMSEFKNTLLNMLSSDDDIMDIIQASANLAQTASLVSSIVSMMKEMSEQDEFGAYQGMGSFASFTSTGLDSDTTRPSAFTQESYDPEAMEAYEEVRDAAAGLFQQVIDTYTIITIESPAETIRLSKTLAAISSSKSYLTRKAQGDLTDLLEMARQNVLTNSETMSVESVKEITQNAVDSCTNIGEVLRNQSLRPSAFVIKYYAPELLTVINSTVYHAKSASLTGDHPPNTDLNTQTEAVKEFDNNLDSPLPDTPMLEDEMALYKSGLAIYNKVEQGEFATGNLKRCVTIQESLMEVLANKQPKSLYPMELNSKSFASKIWKNDAKSLVNKTIAIGGCSVDVPQNALSGHDDGDTYVLAVTTQAAPQIPLPEHSPVSKHSRTLTVTFKNSQGKKLNIKNLETPFRLKIAQDPNAPKVNMSGLKLANPHIPPREDEDFFYHAIEITIERTALQMQFRLTNLTESTQLLVLLNPYEKPKLDEKRTKVKSLCLIPSDTSLSCAGTHDKATEPDPCTCFVDADIIAENTGTWYAAIRQLLPSEVNKYKKMKSLPKYSPSSWKEYKQFDTNYVMNSAEITCAYLNDGDSVVKRDGVKPSPLSTEGEVVCLTTHLTTFVGGWAVAPNTIDWNFVFSNADFFKNPTLYITEIVIALAYIIAMIWARRKDRQDIEKLGLAPLLDNDPRDKYYYEVMVSTGMRRGAGTESKVHFILSGEEEETDVRTFEDKKRPIFTRGSTSGFLMSVSEPLGALSYLRIWHDNSGKGRLASWYLNHVLVRDVQTDKKYYFIANRWFAVEEDDGEVDRVIPVAGKEQMTEFSHLFAETATKNLSDGHLWFSVVARPPQSRFTRCQRVSCCLVLLFTSMLANAMFYGTETSDANAFQFGPFALTSEQIFIGVMSNLIIFPVNFLLITLFRKSRPRKLRPSRVEEAIKSKPERSTSMADVNPRVKSSLDFERPGSSFLMETKRSQSSMSRPETSMSTANMTTVDVKKKKKKKCELPWWFTIVSWILLAIAVLVSAAFVTFYGIMFQDIKCKKWITSMLISFFMSVFFTQPIKVFLFAIILSLIIKNPGDDDDDDDEETPKTTNLEMDEEYLHEEEDEFGFVAPRKPMYKPKPPDRKNLEASRQQRLKEIQMWSVIREIIFYAFFLWILLVISYRNVSTDSYNYKFNMQKVFILTNDTNKAFSKVKNTNDFWQWAQSGMLRGLRAGPYYNDFPAFYMRGYINDKQSRLMGYAVLRQVRTKPNTCRVPRHMEGILDECNAAYDIAQSEDRDFGPGWTALPVNSSREEYKYQTASSLDGYPYWGEMSLYGGGGYVVKLNKDLNTMIGDLEQLENEGWVDKYTRAVFLEFTVYNPSINLFSVSTLLAEFIPSGGVFTTYRFEPCNLLPYMNSALLFQVICEIVYFAFTLFFVFKEVKNIIKQKKEYFFQFWNLVDLSICAMSVTAIVIYFYRLFCINKLTEYFNETHGNEYMKFQYVGYWSEIFNYIIGFLVFFATLKFLKLLRFNRKISMLSDTLRNSSKHLIHFSIIFNIVFLAFIQVFYLVYMSHLDIFKTFLSSCEAGIVMMMGKFDIYSMLGVNQWLTQVFIFLFVVTVTFIVVNMLLSILNDTFTAVRNDTTKQQNDYEIVDFMLGRFKMWTGIGRGSTTITPSEMEERNQRYSTLEGQIDYFPDQIDRFLASISNMYMGDAKFEDFLHKGMAKKMAVKAQQAETSHPPPRYRGALRISNGARGMTDVQTD